MSARFNVAWRDLQVLADIGVHHHEVGRPQPLTIHVELAVAPPRNDSKTDAVDYVRIKAAAEALAMQRIVLIETFARRLAEDCLNHPLVAAAHVMVEKPQGVPGAMASASVHMERAGG